MVDLEKLKTEIDKSKLTISEIAERIGIDKSTLYRKLNGTVSTFSIKEAGLISRELGFSAKKMNDIFFSDKSHKSDKRPK